MMMTKKKKKKKKKKLNRQLVKHIIPWPKMNYNALYKRLGNKINS